MRGLYRCPRRPPVDEPVDAGGETFVDREEGHNLDEPEDDNAEVHRGHVVVETVRLIRKELAKPGANLPVSRLF